MLTESGTFELRGVTTPVKYRPVVYLKENVMITGGNGQEGSKYEIALSE